YDVAKVVRHLRERAHDVVLRQPLDDTIFVARPAARSLELVVEEVVAFLERLRVRRALLLAAAVDVQVRQDPQQPGAQVRAGCERAPAAKRARIRLLHQILGLLAGADEMAGHSIHLIRQSKRVLLEAHAIARFSRQLPCVGLPCGLAHFGPPYQGLLRVNVWLSTHIPSSGQGTSRKPPRAISSSSESRFVRSSSQASVTCPIRLALASSRPSCPSSTFASRMTQRSQRIPLTWIVSVTTAIVLRYRPLDEIRADSREAVGTADLELAVGFACLRVEPVQGNRQLARQRRDGERFVAVRVNEFPVRPEARGGPAVLLVDAALGGLERSRRRLERPGAEPMPHTDEGARVLDRGRLVRRPNLERSE